MASEDIARLAETLASTQVGGGELSFKGEGRKIDTAEDAEEIVKEIEKFEGLHSLRLGGNTVGVEAAKAIATALEKKPELKNCYWSDMFTGRLRSEIPIALTSLGQAVITSGAQLTELDLSDNAFGPDGVRSFEVLLRSPACFTLKNLKLNNCGMGVGGGKILADALIDCHVKSKSHGKPMALKVFVAGRNRLENEGATALAGAFKLIGSLEEVHMPQNGIGHNGITMLASAFSENPLLRIINLNDNIFTEKGAVAMAETLKVLRNIEVLNFGDCLVRSKGAIAIAEVLKNGLHKLKELNLSFGEIKRNAAVAVAEAVEGKTELEKLDLNGNCLGDDGCEQVREALENFNMGTILGSLSEDEEEDEDEEIEEEEDEDEEEEDDEEEEEEEQEECEAEDDECEDDLESTEKTTELKGIEPAAIKIISPHSKEDASSFLDFPSPDKLLKLGPKRGILITQQIDLCNEEKVVQLFLKTTSVYKDDNAVKTAVEDTIDTLLDKAFSSSKFNTHMFLTTLLVHMGLLKSEEKIKPVPSLNGPLMALNHAVQQKYFPNSLLPILLAFVTKPNKALDSCSLARHTLLQTLYH